MKIRLDFVTNSSSSSFIIAKKYLTENQILAIHKHILLGNKLGIRWSNPEEGWKIEENEDFISGSTYMDNFDMETFLNEIEISSKHINWSEWPFNLEEMEEETIETEDNNWEKLLKELTK